MAKATCDNCGRNLISRRGVWLHANGFVNGKQRKAGRKDWLTGCVNPASRRKSAGDKGFKSWGATRTSPKKKRSSRVQVTNDAYGYGMERAREGLSKFQCYKLPMYKMLTKDQKRKFWNGYWYVHNANRTRSARRGVGRV